MYENDVQELSDIFFFLRDCGDSHSFLGFGIRYKSNDNEVTKFFKISTFSAFTRAETAIYMVGSNDYEQNWLLIASCCGV